eukprot:5621749-Pleurochrysis_carterae.AAC.1
MSRVHAMRTTGAKFGSEAFQQPISECCSACNGGGRQWKAAEGSGRRWRAVEGNGGQGNAMEKNMLKSGSRA